MLVLVTGGAGEIGKNVVRGLLSKDHQVRTFGHAASPIGVPDKVHVFEGDLLDVEALARAMSDVDAVVHLAARSRLNDPRYTTKDFYLSNVVGTQNVLDLALAMKDPPRLVIASSVRVIGEGVYRNLNRDTWCYPLARSKKDMQAGEFDCTIPSGNEIRHHFHDERNACHPCSHYGSSKLAMEQAVERAVAIHGLNACVLRFENVYGPGISVGAIPGMTKSLLRHGTCSVSEDGLSVRSAVHIEDIQGVITEALRKSATGVFNVTSSHFMTLHDLAKRLIEVTGVPDFELQATGQFQLDDSRHQIPRGSKIGEQLEWEPRVDFRDSLIAYVDWARTHYS